MSNPKQPDDTAKYSYTDIEEQTLLAKELAKEHKALSASRQMGKSLHGYDLKRMAEEFTKMYKGFNMAEENRPKVDKLKAKRKELQGYLNKIDKCIEHAEKLQFKDGDVIYSKEHGPIVVTEVIVDIDEPAYANDPFAKEPFKFFYKGYAKGGMVSVRSDEALPFNETTKLLYEKNRS